MESTLKRTWAEIDLDALAHNYGRLRQHIGPKVRFLGVVKADAYGHGAVQVARTLQELGADYLAVSSIDEAMELRANGVTMPVLILGHTPKEQVGRLIEHHITQAVTCKAKALEYSREAAALGVLSMARAQAMDSAGSQFFIMHKDAPHLDGQYAAFGMVIDGMDVVDEIVSQPRNMITNKPKKPQVMKSVTVDTQGVEYPEPDKLPDPFHK